jgi:hypothetical protein
VINLAICIPAITVYRIDDDNDDEDDDEDNNNHYLKRIRMCVRKRT